MKIIASLHRLWRLALGLLVLPCVSLWVHGSPTTTQVITLNPGWNAVHFDVLPANPDLDAVFDGVPLDSVWAYGNGLGSPDFVQELTEQTLAKAGWFSWVPTNRVDAFQNSLFQIQVNQSYLIRYTGTNAQTLSFVGTPTARQPKWLPDSYNFRGLAVDPAIPPTFLKFFAPSPAHYSASTGLNAIFRLDPAGVWQRVAPTDLVRRGEAYWIYCRGGSDYVAPFVAAPELGSGLEFNSGTDELVLNLQNKRTSSANVTVTDLGAPIANPLWYAERQSNLSLLWQAMPTPWVKSVPAGTTVPVRISVRRTDMKANLFETVLEVTDGLGSRQLVPITVFRPAAATAGASTNRRKIGTADVGQPPSAEVSSHVGLWVGVATVNAVSEAHSGPLITNVVMGFTIQLETNATTGKVTTNRIPNSLTRTSPSMAPTPTGSEFNLRLLLHVDGNGQTRLLKQVIEMWQDGTSTNDVDGNTVLVTPGHYVLLTDDSLIGQFTGVSARDGVPVGRRLSSAGFDFADNELPLAGDFAIGSSVVGTNTMSETFQRNPFKHRYHPDHQKGYDITRVIGLQFSGTPTNAPPGYGERVLDGLYRETVTGLHRTNIVVGGTFRLNRIATTAVLNQ